MKRLTLFTILALFAVACGTGGGRGGSAPSVAVPGRAQLDIFVEPNPIVAKPISGNLYEFPFTIGIREVGGVAVEVQRVGIEVRGLGAISLYQQTYSREEIARRGFPTALSAHGELRYSFSQRREVPDERLFSAVSADIFAEGTDANGNSVRATERVTMTR